MRASPIGRLSDRVECSPGSVGRRQVTNETRQVLVGHRRVLAGHWRVLFRDCRASPWCRPESDGLVRVLCLGTHNRCQHLYIVRREQFHCTAIANYLSSILRRRLFNLLLTSYVYSARKHCRLPLACVFSWSAAMMFGEMVSELRSRLRAALAFGFFLCSSIVLC